ncbi:MAG: glycosyltransferase family 2 protein [Proteobacteria bacterium]|nr:glycosyltransferase family 2 protein [Pseudomonadota bacterium]MBU1585970.1 glycosyltransferase family 2 protein [Pseudomonadota bacterium]MBU2631470.1 glycosyltransferase family 2 protein [Pseudomonadota bacterium]
MKLSIVAALYKSEAYITGFYQRVTDAAKQVVGDEYQIILVNDGSTDNSCEVAVQLTKDDHKVSVIDLSRNFGHHKAMMTGLMHAKGDRVFLIDCDLEEPPEALIDWWGELDKNIDIDVIYGVQALRKGNWFKRISGHLFYRLVNALSPVKLTPNSIVARLMSARYVKELIKHQDQEMYLFGLTAFTGFTQQAAVINKNNKDHTSYTLIKRLSLFFNAITSFSNYPLYLIFYAGLSISLSAFLFVAYLVIRWLVYPEQGNVIGWTSLAVSIWAVGGFVLTALGIIGIYIAKIFSEVKSRPISVIRKIYGNIE